MTTTVTAMTTNSDSQISDDDREICVTLDAGAINRHSLAVAIMLAERFKSGLRGVLVEHTYVRAVALLPFATEIVRSTGEERRLLSESLEKQSLRDRALLERLLAQSAAPRRVRYRIESAPGERPSLAAFLASHRDVFLPAARVQRRPLPTDRVDSVKWVYDGSEQSARALMLLRQLMESGKTLKVYLLATCAVPRSLVAELTGAGARVFWVNIHSENSLIAQLVSAPVVDLVVVPGGLVDEPMEKQLVEAGRSMPSPILIVG